MSEWEKVFKKKQSYMIGEDALIFAMNEKEMEVKLVGDGCNRNFYIDIKDLKEFILEHEERWEYED